jgi:hypothetical protein
LGPEIDFLITGLSYIRFSYNRKILEITKSSSAGTLPALSYIRIFLYPAFL